MIPGENVSKAAFWIMAGYFFLFILLISLDILYWLFN